MVEALLLLLLAAGWIYWLFAWWLARRFFRTRPRASPGFCPPASILKPVRGIDAQALRNYASFCRQEYPEFELLFGFSDPEDPAVALVRQLQCDFPDTCIRIVTGPVLGPNRKASLLHHLVGQARYDILVISDSDMRVTPDYLQRVVAPLADPTTGLVTCCYRGETSLTLSAGLEALHMGVSFLPSVIVANMVFKLGFGMGATGVVRRSDLIRLGGFKSITDFLADDYQLGARISQLGLKVHLSDYVVAAVLGATRFREQWNREVRWNRCARVSRPWYYPGLLITFITPLALLLTMLSGFATIGWQALLVSLLVRWLVAYLISGYTDDTDSRHWLLWLPIRDLLSAVVWLVGGLGRRIVWRGDKFVLRSDGRMEALQPSTRSWLTDLRAWRL
jgi:ceramide glucosyltransferase